MTEKMLEEITEMTNHDYKAALEWVKQGMPFKTISAQQFSEHQKHIIHGLKVTDKMMQEPSEEAIYAGVYSWDKNRFSIFAIFKAMRDQMLREVE